MAFCASISVIEPGFKCMLSEHQSLKIFRLQLYDNAAWFLRIVCFIDWIVIYPDTCEVAYRGGIIYRPLESIV